MTDDEIETLAQEILGEIADELFRRYPQVCRTLVSSKTGERYFEFFGTSKLGHGGFRCLYFPHQALKNLISIVDTYFDEVVVTLANRQTGEISSVPLSEYAAEHRQRMIEIAARSAGTLLVGSFFPRITDLFYDEYSDHEMIAKAALGETIEWLSDDEFYRGPPADFRDDIDRAVARVADRKRKVLSEKFSALPNVVSERRRGAPAKTVSQRDKERREYLGKAQEVYRELYVKHGTKPRKTAVAKALREGGVNTKTGSDSSLQAFNLKLRRLEISYDDITRSIDEELNNNS